jgi:hypothetical protein
MQALAIRLPYTVVYDDHVFTTRSLEGLVQLDKVQDVYHNTLLCNLGIGLRGPLDILLYCGLVRLDPIDKRAVELVREARMQHIFDIPKAGAE